MKIYISADIEGVAGVVSAEQLGPEGFEYQEARRWMTAEVCAAIEGARAAGAGEVVVSDSHGNGQNILIDQLPAGTRLVRSWPRPLGMMEGLDESFAGAILLGYHTGTHSPHGVRAHTMSSAAWFEVRLDGKVISEAELNAAIAGHFAVPILCLTGDDALETDLRESFPAAEFVVVKKALGFHCADCLRPEDAQALIRKSTERAVAKRDAIAPHPTSRPNVLEITFKNYRPSEVLAYLPGVERTSSHAVRFRAADILEVSRIIEFLLNYRADLAP